MTRSLAILAGMRALVASAILMIGGVACEAQTVVTYTGPNNGNWNTAGNWSGGGVPINGGPNTYAVTIPASRTVIFDVPGAGNQISSLTVPNTSAINFTAVGGGGLEVLGGASLGGTYQVSGDKTFTAVGAGTTFDTSRFLTCTGNLG